MSRPGLAKLTHQQVVCPHCWHQFHDDEAWYISKHDQLRGDPVISNPDAYKRFGPHEVAPDRAGIVRDPNGLEMTDRACPRCHLQVPDELLARRPFFFSIGGAPFAGKTYFLTSMLHQLGLQMAQQFKFTFSYCDSEEARTLQKFEKTLFRGPRDADTFLEKTREEHHTSAVTLDGMKMLLPKPFMFRLMPTPDHPGVAAGKRIADANFVFYDNAGETFDPEKNYHRQASNQTTRHLAHSSGVIFVFDILQDASVRERLAGSADPQVCAKPKDCEQRETLENVINQIRAFRGLAANERIDVPLAVCVQKFDAWKSLLPEWATIDDTSIEWLEKHGVAALHLEEINHNSLIVRDQLEAIAPQFVKFAEQHFSIVRYFPVSALGVSPKVGKAEDGSEVLVVRRGDVNPVRVTDPLLWLLSRWKFVHTAVTKKRNGPPLAVVGQTPDRVTLQFPSGRRLTLDWEYCGTNIVDPASGTPCHVPDLERPKPVAQASSSSSGGARAPGGGPTGVPPLPQQRKPGLTLDNPEAQKKRKGGLWDG